jgi:hypothetical protein
MSKLGRVTRRRLGPAQDGRWRNRDRERLVSGFDGLVSPKNIVGERGMINYSLNLMGRDPKLIVVYFCDLLRRERLVKKHREQGAT